MWNKLVHSPSRFTINIIQKYRKNICMYSSILSHIVVFVLCMNDQVMRKLTQFGVLPSFVKNNVRALDFIPYLMTCMPSVFHFGTGERCKYPTANVFSAIDYV